MKMNYRPVSLLSQFSKILEKWFAQKLFFFLEKHKLITEKQYGFRAKRSTALALIELIEKITSVTENKQDTVGVFIDFSKAFDTINHSLLLSKSYNYGIRGLAHQWLKSYLNNRQQFVRINGQRSELTLWGPRCFWGP